MRRLVVFGIRVGYVLAIGLMVWLVWGALRPAKQHSGPTPRMIIWFHLQTITEAKEKLKMQRGLSDDYWPTRAELAVARTGKTNDLPCFEQTSWGEMYIINKIGAPAYAYLSHRIGDFPEGCLLTLKELEPAYNMPSPPPSAGRSPGDTNQVPRHADPHL